ncbi:His-Xaa-Ser system protein HxsD [Bacterioplanoides sp.]|uniref:His-Xaa-Ser system protein HxsD n=1 Tax=Bacterioplanoides sp. TaxID=2066072 RepID=UPI003B594503
MEVIRYSNQDYSEWVIRNALYWMGAHTEWKLEKEGREWVIHFVKRDESLHCEFDRLLNDYVLREKLMKSTQAARDEIAHAVLKGIADRLSA